MLAAVPEQLDSVEFGAVGRQEQQRQSLGCPSGVALLRFGALFSALAFLPQERAGKVMFRCALHE